MIKKIEEFSMNAFPALSTVLLNGWVLRFSDGYAKRANSVNLIYECSIDVLKNIEICEEMYKRNNLDTVFKLTEKEDNNEIDVMLSERGYEYVAKTNIMLKEIADFKISKEEKQGFVVYRELRNDWLVAFTQINKISSQNASVLQKMLQRIIPDVYYGAIVENGEIIAVGMGVAEQGYVGMYDIYVHDDKRRKGLGTKIMNNLIYEALKDGCTHSYLQVVDENEKAKNLYNKLGYEKQYSYWYRVRKLLNKELYDI
ncbi:GNAT family N-acetyltransferase [Oceanirhabdus seepicola]|uniref:GNAT family N-acetyltransferase n=1 Tax=Oceanirhabdus seepicola TaxID=2828781 RepID=A0A9J6P570_9CLOT|nr:GNAT family N-acetyltransferase [Oceanirhabdus seepicola]MCM1991847.1 GNAT family N-acetyltransferase [Oceanirhabdus seepicola]